MSVNVNTKPGETQADPIPPAPPVQPPVPAAPTVTVAEAPLEPEVSEVELELVRIERYYHYRTRRLFQRFVGGDRSKGIQPHAVPTDELNRWLSLTDPQGLPVFRKYRRHLARQPVRDFPEPTRRNRTEDTGLDTAVRRWQDSAEGRQPIELGDDDAETLERLRQIDLGDGPGADTEDARQI